MIPFELAELAALTGGELLGVNPGTVVDGPVVADSRRVAAGSLFVCVRGDHSDGHDFAAAAVAAGAVAVLAARPVGAPAMVVADPVEAVGRIAAEALRRTPGCSVTGITGSAGKTSTKDLIGRILTSVRPTVYPEASFNNELGLPLTVLRIGVETTDLVLEYSARGIGHIRYLCGVAQPSVAVVLNVGNAHLGEFGSPDAVATAKGELVEALDSDGTAVLNADDPRVAAMRTRTAGEVICFGTDPSADVVIERVTLDGLARPWLRLATPWGKTELQLRLHGAHHASNAAAAATTALVRGVPLDAVTQALEAAGADSAHRMALHQRSDGLLVVDDAYNANPESMRAAVDALRRLGEGRAGRKWAVLGQMLELGEESEPLHESVGRYAAESGVDDIVAVGDAAAPILRGARQVAGWRGRDHEVADIADAVRLLRSAAGPQDVVLVKASMRNRLWQVAEQLLDDESQRPSETQGASA